MASPIRLTTAISSGRRDLRFFAGRSLGENEFDLMQTYVAGRCNALLIGSQPGVVFGLRVTVDGQGTAAAIKVQQGLALGGDGRPIQALAPIDLDWTAVLEEFKTRTRAPDAPDTPLSGWFYLTVKRGVMIVDHQEDAKAATRTDPDLLRDSRLETLATLDLQPVSTLPELLALPARRAISRLQAQALAASPFDRATGAVPLALLKIQGDVLAIEDGAPVVDPIAGRFLAIDHAAHAALLARWSEEVRRLDSLPAGRFGRPIGVRPIAPTRRPFGRPVIAPPLVPRPFPVAGRPSIARLDRSLRFDPDKPLAEQLGVDVLPAAGPFPEDLLLRIAGRPDGTGWSLPERRFDPEDLQIELMPVRSSQVNEMIEREMARGVVDLVNRQGDRLRVLVAVPDRDFSPDLMDLPETDSLLNDAVYRRIAAARGAWQAWALVYAEIFAGLDRDVSAADDPVSTADEATFRGIRIPPPPIGVFPNIEALPAAKQRDTRRRLGIAESIAPLAGGFFFFRGLRRNRQREADAAGQPLPRPYAQGNPKIPDDHVSQPTGLGELPEGLYRQRADLLEQISWLEDELDANDRLVADYDVFIRAQRQQVDSITVSFTALAGGVPGDGSGLQLAKWMPFRELKVKEG